MGKAKREDRNKTKKSRGHGGMRASGGHEPEGGDQSTKVLRKRLV